MQAETPSGWGPSDEMCNMYTMVWSRLPYFQLCGNGVSQVLCVAYSLQDLSALAPSYLWSFTGHNTAQTQHLVSSCSNHTSLHSDSKTCTVCGRN